MFSSTMVNEFRVGYNYDKAVAPEQLHVQEVNAQLGLETAPSVGPERARLPALEFAAGSANAGPRTSTTGGFNVDRTIRQNAFSISDNLSWVMGGHSLKAGALWNRNLGHRRPRPRHQLPGQLPFNGAATGNALADFLLGSTRDASRTASSEPRPTSTGHSNDFAVFVQDDWKVTKTLTVFLGLRYEIAGRVAREGRHPRRTSFPRTAATTWSPNEQVAARLPPGADRDRPHPPRGRGRPARHPHQHRQEQLQSPGRTSPGGWADDNKTVLRGGSRPLPPDGRGPGNPRPPGLERVPLHEHAATARPSPTASRRARARRTPPTTATRASTRTSRARTSTSTT